MSRDIITRRSQVRRNEQKTGGTLLVGGGGGPRSLGPLLGLDSRHLPTGFERWRSELDQLSGMKLLDALTEPSNAAACIQTLPVDDLHRYLFEIGLEDAEAVLALASADQVKRLLDIEVWDRSSLLPARVDAWLFALQRAGAAVLFERVLDLDDAILNWIVKRDVFAFVIEDPESFDPPDQDHILTPDRRLCIVFPRSAKPEQTEVKDTDKVPLQGGAGDAPIKQFTHMLMESNPEFCIHLALASTSALNSQLEEEAYRWRAARMSDLGFVDFYEAREIYTPPPADWRRALPPQRIEGELPPSKSWLVRVIAQDERLDRAFAALNWDDALTVAELLGYVANMTISADRIPLWDRTGQEKTLRRLQAGLTISLELMNGLHASPEADAEILTQHHLNFLFRLGYEQMTKAAEPVWRVAHALKREDDESGALDALPRLKSWADGLLGDHPEGRGERGEVTQLQSLEDCRVAREGALLIADLVEVSQPFYAELLAQIVDHSSSDEGRLGTVTIGPLLIAAYTRDVLGTPEAPLVPLSLTSARLLHDHCFEADLPPVLTVVQDEEDHEDLPPPLRALRPDAARAISDWWSHRGGQTKTAPLALLRELREQVGAVASHDLDLKFTPLFWSPQD